MPLFFRNKYRRQAAASCTSYRIALLCFITEAFRPVIRLEERIRLDRVCRKYFIDESLAVDLADAHVFVEMLVVAINLDRAFRCIKGDAASSSADLVDIKAACLLDGCFPEINGIVSGFDRVICDAVFTVRLLVGGDELLIGRRLCRLVVIPRNEIALDVLCTDALDLLFGN